MGWEITESRSDGETPFVISLQWGLGSGAAHRAGEIELKAGFSGGSIRQRHQPCDGSWGFEHLAEKQRIQEEIRLWPDENVVEGASELWLTLYQDGKAIQTMDGRRKVSLGKIRIEKSTPPG